MSLNGLAAMRGRRSRLRRRCGLWSHTGTRLDRGGGVYPNPTRNRNPVSRGKGFGRSKCKQARSSGLMQVAPDPGVKRGTGGLAL